MLVCNSSFFLCCLGSIYALFISTLSISCKSQNPLTSSNNLSQPSLLRSSKWSLVEFTHPMAFTMS